MVQIVLVHVLRRGDDGSRTPLYMRHRFCIMCEIFSDNTAHTVLRIVRELVVNALRHGQAGKGIRPVDGDRT